MTIFVANPVLAYDRTQAQAVQTAIGATADGAFGPGSMSAADTWRQTHIDARLPPITRETRDVALPIWAAYFENRLLARPFTGWFETGEQTGIILYLIDNAPVAMRYFYDNQPQGLYPTEGSPEALTITFRPGRKLVVTPNPHREGAYNGVFHHPDGRTFTAFYDPRPKFTGN